MSGTGLIYDFSDLGRLTERIARLSRIEKRDLLDSVGALIESQTRRRIASEKESPEGEPWPDWSARYAGTREAHHSLLVGEGNLIDSITHLVSGDTVEIGGNLIYQATHQFGDRERGIPQREHLGISAEDAEDVEDLVERFFERMLS